ncbi:MAG: MBL fold metallo-hydrolase [Synergistales bacterium]|nr:MBL fold metallo-hydrolase [Synergistales bacterium]
MFYKRFPLGPLWTNGYLFWDSDRYSFFVDPGGDPIDVIQYIKNHGLKLNSIFLTHGHIDHILGVEALVGYSGADLYVHEKDLPRLADSGENLSSWMGNSFSTEISAIAFNDGSVFRVGSYSIKVIHTPGHTPGSSCLLVSLDKEQILLSGDTLFTRSVGRTDLPGGDGEELLRSLKKLVDLPEDIIVLPGHGPDTILGEEIRNNPFWPL